MRNNYKTSYHWIMVENEKDDYPLFPLSRINREGKGGMKCPHCHSDTETYGNILGRRIKLSIPGKYIAKQKEHYCINTDCIYYYFRIDEGDKKFTYVKDIKEFVTHRIRKNKLKRILK